MKWRFLESLDADDVFISYSRSDGSAYLNGLVAALSARGFSCYSDKSGTEAHPLPPETLFRRIELCKTLVLLGTAGAVAVPDHIESEVRTFANVNGTARIIPISFDRDQEKLADWSKASWHPHVVGKSREREDAGALKTGAPLPAIVDNIVSASNYMKSKDRLRAYRNRALALFLFLLIASAVAAGFAVVLSKTAEAERLSANAEAQRASLQQRLAQQARREAAAQTEAANTQKGIAEAAAKEAVRQQTIADARALANRSQSLLRRQPDAVPRSIDLAIAGLTKAISAGVRLVEADTALRESAAFLAERTDSFRIRGVNRTALSPDARYLAARLNTGGLRIYDLAGKKWKDLPIGEEGHAFALSGSAAHLAIDTETEFVVEDLSGGGSPRRIPKPQKDFNVQHIALSPRGRYLAVITKSDDVPSHMCPEPTTVSLWDTVKRSRIADLKSGLSKNNDDKQDIDLVFGAGGDLVLGVSTFLDETCDRVGGRTIVWRLSNKFTEKSEGELTEADLAKRETTELPAAIRAVATGQGGRSLATQSFVRKRDALGSFERLTSLPPKSVAHLAFTSEGWELVVVRDAHKDVVVERWDVSDRRDFNRAFVDSRVARVGFTPDANRFAAALEESGAQNPHLFDLRTRLVSLPATSGQRLAYSSADARFAVIRPDETSVVVNDGWRSKSIRIALDREMSMRNPAALSSGGEILVVADKREALLFARRGDTYHRIQSPTIELAERAEIRSVAITPEGRRLIVGDGTKVRVRDLASGLDATPRALLQSTDVAVGFLLSPRGTYLTVRFRKPRSDYVDYYLDGVPEPEQAVTVRLADGVIVHRASYRAPVSAIAFSPGDRYLMTASQDRKVTFAALDGSGASKIMSNDLSVTSVAFSDDEQSAAMGFEDGVVQIAAISDLDTELVRLQDTGRITALAFSRDGRKIISASARESSPNENRAEDHAVRIWLLDPAELIANARKRIATSGR